MAQPVSRMRGISRYHCNWCLSFNGFLIVY